MQKKYLNVAYADRDLAKRLGARWDASVKKWYCLPGSPLSKIYSWRADTRVVMAGTSPQTGMKAHTSAHSSTRNLELPLLG